jgi:hypothetical protein
VAITLHLIAASHKSEMRNTGNQFAACGFPATVVAPYRACERLLEVRFAAA